MTKKKKTADVAVDTLRPGDNIVCPDGTTRKLKVLDPIVDPRGGKFLTTVVSEWLAVFEDGHKMLLGEEYGTSVVQLETR